MESLGRFQRVLNGLPKEGKPEATSKARPMAKKPRGCRPQGVLGLWTKDVAKGSPLENPKGGLQYSSEGVH